MRRAIRILSIAGAFAGFGLAGCQGVKYVQKDANGGVIEFDASQRDATIAKLKSEVGEIEIEVETPKSKPSGPFDPKSQSPIQMSERMAATSGGNFASRQTLTEENKVQLKYRKVLSSGATPAGLPPAPKDDGIQQAGAKVKASGSTLPTPDMTGLGGK